MKILHLRFMAFAVPAFIFAFSSCSGSDDVQTSIRHECYIDSVSTVAVEDILNVNLSGNAVVALSDNTIVGARYDSRQTKKHYLDLKRMGRSEVMVNDGGTVYTLSLTVKSALINWTNHWIVNDADETIVCSQEIRRELTDDFHSHSVIPVMGNGWRLFSQYGLDKCSVSSPDSGDTTLLVGYDMDSAEYVFTSKDNAGAEQRLRFAVKYRDEYGKRNGELKCDMTGYYQNKYGREKVQRVGITYTVREERELN